MALTVPQEYGYVLATASVSVFVNQYLMYRVGEYRRAAKVAYPNAYATNAEAKEDKAKYLFNCAQRAHVSFTEHWPSMLIGLLAGGLKYPVASSAMASAWLVARVVYAIGYTKKDGTKGEGRAPGNVFYLPEAALQVLAGLTAYKVLTG